MIIDIKRCTVEGRTALYVLKAVPQVDASGAICGFIPGAWERVEELRFPSEMSFGDWLLQTMKGTP